MNTLSQRLGFAHSLGALSMFLAMLLGGFELQAQQGLDKGTTPKRWQEKYTRLTGGMVFVVAFAPDGKTFAAGSASSNGEHVRIWATENGEEITKIKLPNAGTAIKFAPAGKSLAIGALGKVVVWSLADKKQAMVLPGFDDSVIGIDISSDGGKLVACDFNRFTVFDLATGKPVVADSPPGKRLHAVAFSPHGKLVAVTYNHFQSSTEPSELVVWDLEKKKVVHRLHHPSGALYTARFVLNDAALAVGGRANQKEGPPKGGAFLWNLDTGKSRVLGPELQDTVFSIAAAPKLKLLAAANGQVVNFWTSTGDALGSQRLNLGEIGVHIKTLDFAPDGNDLVIGATNGKVQLLHRP